MCVHQGHVVTTEDRGRHQTPWHWSCRCLEAAMWLLGIEAGSSVRAAISPGHLIPLWLLLPWNHLSTMVMPSLAVAQVERNLTCSGSLQLIPTALDKLLGGGVMVQDSKLIKVIPAFFNCMFSTSLSSQIKFLSSQLFFFLFFREGEWLTVTQAQVGQEPTLVSSLAQPPKCWDTGELP